MSNTSLISTWSITREMDNIFYYLQKIGQGWQSKIIFGTVTASLSSIAGTATQVHSVIGERYADLFKGDAFILAALLYIMLVDLFLGLAKSLKKGPDGKREFSSSILGRGICKYPLYALYVLLTGVFAICIDRTLGVGGSFLLNLFVSYLVATEIRSVIENLRALGVKVPIILLTIIDLFQRKTETSIKDVLHPHKPWSQQSRHAHYAELQQAKFNTDSPMPDDDLELPTSPPALENQEHS